VAALQVPEFVSKDLHGLGVVDVVADPHHPAGRVGVAVSAATVTALQSVAISGDLAGQVLPQAGRSLAAQQHRRDLRQRVAFGLGDVKHVHHPEPPQLPAAGGRCGRSPALIRRLLAGAAGRAARRLRPVGARRQDRQAPLPLTHLPAQALPAAEPRDPGGLRRLQRNQHQIPQAVAMELRGGVQHRSPPLGLHQRRDTLADLLMQRSEPVLPASLRAGCAAGVGAVGVCAGAHLSLLSRPPKRVRVGRCPPALRAVGSPLRRKAARRGRSGSPGKGSSPRSFPRSA